MAEVIGFQDGIASTKDRLEKLDPATGEVAYANQAKTLATLKKGHNEVWASGGLASRLAAVEEAVRLGPFG